jgi:phosphoribosylamine-glycine ligase
VNKPVNLGGAYKLEEEYVDAIRTYPGSMELREDKTYALTSRAVCVVGVADDIPSAKEISIDGVEAIKGGSLWFRKDIASEEHVKKSIAHMRTLRKR